MMQNSTDRTIRMIERCCRRQPIYSLSHRCARCGTPVTVAAKYECATCAIKAEIAWMERHFRPRRR